MSTKKTADQILEEMVGPINFGMFVRVCRTSLDLTQVEMAKKLKMARGTLCDIEKGRQLVSPKLALKIAKIAGMHERFALELCLEDHLKKQKIKYKIKVLEKEK